MIFYGKKTYNLLKEVKCLMAKTYAAIDEIVRLADGLIGDNAALVIAVRAANERAAAATEELAQFRAIDDAEDARQLALADEETAQYGATRAAELAARIDAAKADPSVPVTPDDAEVPGADVKPDIEPDEPAQEPVSEPETAPEVEPATGPALEQPVDATEGASVLVVTEAPVEVVDPSEERDDDAV